MLTHYKCEKILWIQEITELQLEENGLYYKTVTASLMPYLVQYSNRTWAWKWRRVRSSWGFALCAALLPTSCRKMVIGISIFSSNRRKEMVTVLTMQYNSFKRERIKLLSINSPDKTIALLMEKYYKWLNPHPAFWSMAVHAQCIGV